MAYMTSIIQGYGSALAVKLLITSKILRKNSKCTATPLIRFCKY